MAYKYPVQSWGHLGTWPVRYCFEVNKKISGSICNVILISFINSSYIIVFFGVWLHKDCLYRTWADFPSPSSSMIMNCMWTNDVIMMSLRNLSQSLKIKGHEIIFLKIRRKRTFNTFSNYYYQMIHNMTQFVIVWVITGPIRIVGGPSFRENWKQNKRPF